MKHLSASVYGSPESVMIHIITPKRNDYCKNKYSYTENRDVLLA